MANQIIIDIGAAANDGTGDPLRTAFNYVNNNFSNVWNTGLPTSNVQFSDNRILTVNTNANLVLAPNGIGKVASNVDIVPNTANVFALGSSTRRWNTVYGQYLDLSHNATIGGNLVVTGNLSAGNISYTSNVFVGDLEGSVFDGASSIVLDVIDSAIYVDNYRYANGVPVTFGGNYSNANVASFLPTYTGNITSGNLFTTGNLFVTNTGTFFGNIDVYNRISAVLGVFSNTMSANNITANSSVTTVELYGTTGTFTGDQYSDGALYVGSPAGTVLGSDVVIQITANAGGYSQTNFQNISNAATASGDYILTADNGNDTTHYLDMGITSSGWDGSETNVLSGLVANNGYLYVQDGNLTLGTRNGSTSYKWNFDTTGNLTVAGNVLPTGNNTQSLGSATQQWNDLYLSNATIYMNSVPIGLTSGNVLTVNGADVVTTAANGESSIGNLNIVGTVIEIAEGAPDTLINISPDTEGWAYLQLPTNDTANTADTRLHNDAGNIEFGTGDFSTGSTSYTWTFDNTGKLTAPGEVYGQFYTIRGGNGPGADIGSLGYAGNIVDVYGVEGVRISTIDESGPFWQFDITGNLAIPGTIVADSTILFDNRESGNTADIQIYSADDILLQGRDRTLGDDIEGGDINIYAGDGSPDDAGGGTGSGGDIQIIGGVGGAADVSSAGGGGTVRLDAGNGGDGSATAAAGSGATAYLSAGDGGIDNGGGGNNGGDVVITAGDTSDVAQDRGSVILNAGGGGDASSLGGYVQVNIPSVGTNPGGQWTFTGSGTTLETPANAEIFGPNFGNLTVGCAGNTIITSADYGFTTYNWVFDNAGGIVAPNLTVTRGDRTGTLTGSTLRIGNGSQEAILTTPNGAEGSDSQRFVINPGAGDGFGEGGDIYLYSGRGGSSGGSGGDIKIRGGLGPADGDGGYLDIMGGEAAGNGAGGYIDILGGQSGNAAGGPVRIYGGQGRVGGDANITGGVSTAGPGGGVNITGGTSSNGLAEYGNVTITAGASTWTFNNTGNLIVPGEGVIRSIDDTIILQSYDTPNSIARGLRVGTNGGLFLEQGSDQPWLSFTVDSGDAEIGAAPGVAGTGNAGYNLTLFGGPADTSVYGTGAGGNINLQAGLGATNDGGGGGPGGSINITAGNSYDPAGVSGNVTVNTGPNTWTFDNTGNLDAPGNITATNFVGNGAALTNVATQVTGSWTLAAGTNTANITVPPNGTYTIWVNGNIPNGIAVWNATVTITNNNVPVIGQQFAWNYSGNALVITSIPSQIIGTAGAISNASPAVGTTTNVFEFSIDNNSGNSQTVDYGWTKLS